MHISFVELEIKVRCIDQRNAPINESTLAITRTGNVASMASWIAKTFGAEEHALFVKLVAKAASTEDPYEDSKRDSDVKLQRSEAQGKGMDSGLQPPLFREGT